MCSYCNWYPFKFYWEYYLAYCYAAIENYMNGSDSLSWYFDEKRLWGSFSFNLYTSIVFQNIPVFWPFDPPTRQVSVPCPGMVLILGCSEKEYYQPKQVSKFINARMFEYEIITCRSLFWATNSVWCFDLDAYRILANTLLHKNVKIL